MAFAHHAQLNCGNCDYGRGRHADAAAYARAEAAGHPWPPLQCLRYPNPLAKRENEMCGEHSELVALRARDGADMIAIAVALQLKANAPGGDRG